MKSVVEGCVVECRVEASKWCRRGFVEVEVETIEEDGLCEYTYEIPTDDGFAVSSVGKRVRVTVEEIEH